MVGSPAGVGAAGSNGLRDQFDSLVLNFVSFLLFSVSKTNLSVHEDKNRVPYVKVRPHLQSALTSLP